jgi:hypothetical protein
MKKNSLLNLENEETFGAIQVEAVKSETVTN